MLFVGRSTRALAEPRNPRAGSTLSKTTAVHGGKHERHPRAGGARRRGGEERENGRSGDWQGTVQGAKRGEGEEDGRNESDKVIRGVGGINKGGENRVEITSGM